jgi:hypothetical protein
VLGKQARREVISYDIDHGVESDVEAELPGPEAPVHGGADARALQPGHQAHDHGARVRRREALRRHLALQQISGYYYYQKIRIRLNHQLICKHLFGQVIKLR